MPCFALQPLLDVVPFADSGLSFLAAPLSIDSIKLVIDRAATAASNVAPKDSEAAATEGTGGKRRNTRRSSSTGVAVALEPEWISIATSVCFLMCAWLCCVAAGGSAGDVPRPTTPVAKQPAATRSSGKAAPKDAREESGSAGSGGGSDSSDSDSDDSEDDGKQKPAKPQPAQPNPSVVKAAVNKHMQQFIASRAFQKSVARAVEQHLDSRGMSFKSPATPAPKSKRGSAAALAAPPTVDTLDAQLKSLAKEMAKELADLKTEKTKRADVEQQQQSAPPLVAKTVAVLKTKCAELSEQVCKLVTRIETLETRPQAIDVVSSR